MTNDVQEPIGVAAARNAKNAVKRIVSTRGAGRRWLLWVFQALVWGVLILAAALMLRLAAAPDTAFVVDAALDERLAADERVWPVDDARDAAARVVVDGLAIGTEDTGIAAADLNRVEQFGREGAVTQRVESVTPGRVEVHDEASATVHLSALVETTHTLPPVDPGDDPVQERTRQWRWMAVPIQNDGGTVAPVSGFVEVPPPPTIEGQAPQMVNADDRYTDQTRDIVDVIFAAWAGGSRAGLDAVTDGTIPLLSDDVELIEVHEWQAAPPGQRSVNAGPADHVVGIADVSWLYGGDVVSRQAYRVELERDEDRWEATAIGPAHHDPS